MPTLSAVIPTINVSQASGTLPVANGGTGATTLTTNNVLLGNGTSALQTVAPGTSSNVLTSNGTAWVSSAPAAPSGPTLTAVASGSLSDGSTVIVNADGTVSVIAIGAQAVGTPVVFENASTSSISATYDSVQQKVVIAYSDAGNSSFGTSIVGTVSGNSISFGTPVVFSSVTTDSISATYDSVQQKVVIAHRTFGDAYGLAIVGTVSGTTISFGTAVTFWSAQVSRNSATYASAQQQIVIAFRKDNNTYGSAVVGTVSGTSITFGTPVDFNSAATDAISATYDANAQRVVIAYRNNPTQTNLARVGTVSGTGGAATISYGLSTTFNFFNNALISITYDSVQQKVVIVYGGSSLFGTSIVGTVSGNTISFGTAVVFRSAVIGAASATYDSNARRVTIAYRDSDTFGMVIAGTVSGTSISFGTAIVFESASTSIISATFHADVQRVVIAYQDIGNSNFGTANVFRNEGTTLTTGNFIGFSNAAYTDGQTATIQIVGSVDDAQSGLTPGQSYYVQPSGALGLSPGVPSVFAGTAVAANKIIVKG